MAELKREFYETLKTWKASKGKPATRAAHGNVNEDNFCVF